MFYHSNNHCEHCFRIVFKFARFATRSVSCSNLLGIYVGIRKRQINTFLKFLSKSNFSEGTLVHHVGTAKTELVVWTSALSVRVRSQSLSCGTEEERNPAWVSWDWMSASCRQPVLRMGYSCHASLGLPGCSAHAAPVLVITALLLALTLCYGSSDKCRRKH